MGRGEREAQVLVRDGAAAGRGSTQDRRGRAGGEKIPLHLAKAAMWGEGGMQDKTKQEDRNLPLTSDPFTSHF